MLDDWYQRKIARVEKKLLLASVISLGAALLLILISWIGHLIHAW